MPVPLPVRVCLDCTLIRVLAPLPFSPSYTYEETTKSINIRGIIFYIVNVRIIYCVTKVRLLSFKQRKSHLDGAIVEGSFSYTVHG